MRLVGHQVVEVYDVDGAFCAHPLVRTLLDSEPDEPGECGAPDAAPGERSLNAIRVSFGAGTPDEHIEEDLAVRLRTYPSRPGYMGQLQAMLSWSSYDRLPEITAPTLVIHGESDRLVPPENGRVIAERIPSARLTLIPHACHILFTDQPDAAHGAMLGFLDELWSPGR